MAALEFGRFQSGRARLIPSSRDEGQCRSLPPFATKARAHIAPTQTTGMDDDQERRW
jgi:hypothetical protein